jgi:ATP-dependent RNA helicase RhlE
MGLKSATLHGDKEQADRLVALNEFRSGKVKVLVATDISSRGIDIADVDYVINYDLPEQPENYVHRVGRTGRGTQKGLAVSFCSPEEKPLLVEIEAYLDKPVEVVKISAQDYSETLHFTADTGYDLNALMKEVEDYEGSRKKKKKK